MRLTFAASEPGSADTPRATNPNWGILDSRDRRLHWPSQALRIFRRTNAWPEDAPVLRRAQYATQPSHSVLLTATEYPRETGQVRIRGRYKRRGERRDGRHRQRQRALNLPRRPADLLGNQELRWQWMSQDPKPH